MLGVSIIGLGRVGGALALSLPKDKYRIDQVVFRNDRFLDPVCARLGNGTAMTRYADLQAIVGDIVIIATQDFEIAKAVTELQPKLGRQKAVFHTSGSKPSSVLSSLRKTGRSIGSIHPLVSIPRPEMGPENFKGAWFCVEGDVDAVRCGKTIATDLGGRPFAIDTKYKTLYHASAVTACGHLVALFDAAVEMMTKCGLSAEDAKAILMPLVKSTVNNLESQSTASALTGTFARADTETLTSHLTTLNENVSDDLLEIYLLLGERSLELAAQQGISAERIDLMRAKVSIAKSKLKW
nr:ketopantoate reductase PanG [uncultured bacterium]